MLITPVLEVDGRDRMVDVYNYRRRKPPRRARRRCVYWGKYVAHDNNRDGMVLSQVLTRNIMASYFLSGTRTVLHDLHESVPFLYTSTGTGPVQRGLDPIVINEWHTLALPGDRRS